MIDRTQCKHPRCAESELLPKEKEEFEFELTRQCPDCKTFVTEILKHPHEWEVLDYPKEEECTVLCKKCCLGADIVYDDLLPRYQIGTVPKEFRTPKNNALHQHE